MGPDLHIIEMRKLRRDILFVKLWYIYQLNKPMQHFTQTQRSLICYFCEITRACDLHTSIFWLWLSCGVNLKSQLCNIITEIHDMCQRSLKKYSALWVWAISWFLWTVKLITDNYCLSQHYSMTKTTGNCVQV